MPHASRLAAIRDLGLEPTQNAEQNEAQDLEEAAFRQAGGQLTASSERIAEAIRSASSFKNLRADISGAIDVGAKNFSSLLAIAIFNVHLLGRAQIWADVVGAKKFSPPTSRLAAIVLDTEFDPLPFQEAIDFWRQKVNLTPGEFQTLEQAARAKAFTIAGRTSDIIRQSINGLIDEALIDGISLSQFQSRANTILDAAGISQRTPWYWETVYRTNLATSYQVGRWQQMTDPAVAAERPYLRYVSARLPTSRPSHVEKHGIVKPIDDSFWSEWYPPNGFNCRCTVMSVSQSLLDRRDWSVSRRTSWDHPDKGFDSNPAAAD